MTRHEMVEKRLLCIYVSLKKSHLGLGPFTGPEVPFFSNIQVGQPVLQYKWSVGGQGKGNRKNVYQPRYKKLHQLTNSNQEGRKLTAVALDGIRRDPGPYCHNNPRYMGTWWEWIRGSTLFFWDWNWLGRYQEEV